MGNFISGKPICALAYPHRIDNGFPRYDFKKPNTLTFEEPDLRTFRNLALAMEAMNKGGNMPCILNAANEIAVFAFLKNRIGFLDMTAVVEQSMEKIKFIEKPTLEELYQSDAEARIFAPILQFGCCKAWSRFTFTRKLGFLPKKGPPLAVRIIFSIRLLFSPTKH